MKSKAAFRLIAPVTVGSALLGASLLSRDSAADRHGLAVRPAAPATRTPHPLPMLGKLVDHRDAARDLSLSRLANPVMAASRTAGVAAGSAPAAIVIPHPATLPSPQPTFGKPSTLRVATSDEIRAATPGRSISSISLRDTVASIDAAIFPIVDRPAPDISEDLATVAVAPAQLAEPPEQLASAPGTWHATPLISPEVAETILLSTQPLVQAVDPATTVSARSFEEWFETGEDPDDADFASETDPPSLAESFVAGQGGPQLARIAEEVAQPPSIAPPTTMEPATASAPQLASVRADVQPSLADDSPAEAAAQPLIAAAELDQTAHVDITAVANPPSPQQGAAVAQTALSAAATAAPLPAVTEDEAEAEAALAITSTPQIRTTPPGPTNTREALAAAPAAASNSPASVAALAQQASRSLDLSPGQQTFPMPDGGPGFTLDDELILQLKVRGFDATDTIIAYGTRDAIYLPLGELAMILDLAIRVSDSGNYASGWFLAEDRTVTIDLRQGLLTTGDRTFELEPGVAQAFEGELFIRSEALEAILPLDLEPSLRSQSILITTREPFPFEERMRREADRARLAQAGTRGTQRETWPRVETPWLPLSFPVADVETRAVSDSQKGTRAEADIRLAGDLAWMTAEAYFSASSRDGLVSSLIELGRRDVDGDLLGPLQATEFAFGDVATAPMPMGLRGTSGRGAYVTNQPFESFSVFDQVDLRGVLPDGYEVELYRNDVLVASTAQAVNGQYEFLQVPVDYGLNVFRIVFYGPQGQRREEVRRISVGDGRLSPGEFEYSFGAVQNGTNVLGVRGPDFRPDLRYGDWQAVGEVAYGFSPAVTGVASAAFFEDAGQERWLASAGIRTGLGGLAVRADVGLSDGGGHAAGLGLGGQALGGAFSLSHFEYGGNFIDEVRSFNSEPLRRSTELDFNTTIGLASGVIGTSLPINLRARHIEYQDGRRQISASLRGSARLPGFIASNTFEYARSSGSGAATFSQLAGDFNLATFNQSSTQFRASLGYQILPQLKLVQVTGDINHAIDERTVVRASAGYSLANDEVFFGASTIREFENFTLALDGQYSPQRGSYALALRLGLSFGRDPLRRNLFVASPGQASSGGVALRAFHDLDGDRVYGPGDQALPDVDFSVFNNVATTDADGFARLGELGNGNPVAVQVDPSSLPDIAMAPVSRGIEIVPRPGRIQALDFPTVELSEIEGTVFFVDGENQRGVSGLRLKLRNAADEHEYWTRTERGGYFFYEQVPPGDYAIVIDPTQAERLGICLDQAEPVVIPSRGTIMQLDLNVRNCS